MTTLSKPRLALALALPLAVFISCALISFSAVYRAYPQRLSLAITLDLIITAPLLFYFAIRTSTASKWIVLRVFMAGMVVAGLILSQRNGLLHVLREWVYPVLELGIVAFVVSRFMAARKAAKGAGREVDFLQHCRSVLTTVLGNAKAARVLASEVAVFYYTFARSGKKADGKTSFSTYQNNGVRLVLSTFLSLFIVETVGMHFLFSLWNTTAAWILTGLSLYTCLQLFAHIRAIRTRPVLLQNGMLHLRNGLMGGEAHIAMEAIVRTEANHKMVPGDEVQKLAFIGGLENHNTALYLNEPVEVIKAFGIKKTARVLLVQIDQQQDFLAALAHAQEQV